MKFPTALVLTVVAAAAGSGARAQEQANRMIPATDELTLLATGAMRVTFTKLLAGFEAATGYKVKATYGSGNGTRTQIISGEPFDVPILQAPFSQVLASGHVIPASATPFATIAVAICVPKGAPWPDISSRAAFTRTLLAAKSVAYSDPNGGGGVAGAAFEQTLASLGIADQVKAKSKLSQSGPNVAVMVAKGEAEIGATPINEVNDPNVDLVGSLPPDVLQPIAIVGFVSSTAKDPAGARALLNYLTSPDAAAAYRVMRLQTPK